MVNRQNTKEISMKDCILLFSKKGDFGITKNYEGINLPAITANVYYALLLTLIQIEIEIFFRKHQKVIQRLCSTNSQILAIRRMIEGVWAKNLEATLIFVDLSKPFDSIHWGRMEKILLPYGLLKETVISIMMQYRHKIMETQTSST